MKGDFSRFTFDPSKHYSSVYMQQGRVQLDADWNEQVDIWNHILATQALDIFGAAGAPVAAAGFAVSFPDNPEDAPAHAHTTPGSDAVPLYDFQIGAGRYYVNGILCQNEKSTWYTSQRDYPGVTLPVRETERYLVYLDVWQRNVTVLDDPTLREIALGDLDTTTRLQTIAQVKVLPIDDEHLTHGEHTTDEEVRQSPEWHALLANAHRSARLKARRQPYATRLDNQLYRVEIHRAQEERVSFTWSRENGAIAFAIEDVTPTSRDGEITYIVSVAGLERETNVLRKGDWVEIITGAASLRGQSHPLYRVMSQPDVAHNQITLGQHNPDRGDPLAHPETSGLILQRWDQTVDTQTESDGGALIIQEETWLDLEHGIQIWFEKGGLYHAGDYWLIPARSITDDIIWPSENDAPLSLPPHGIEHHFCPLALLQLHTDGWKVAKDLRQLFVSLPALSVHHPHVTHKPVAPLVSVPRVLIEECQTDDDLDLEVGDVVSLIPGTANQIVKATSGNARMVYGVVTDLGDDKKRVQVTVYGRTQCKATGKIEPGDLLTPSNADGYATKAGTLEQVISHGKIVGKALSAYDPDAPDTTAVVDILVTLQ